MTHLHQPWVLAGMVAAASACTGWVSELGDTDPAGAIVTSSLRLESFGCDAPSGPSPHTTTCRWKLADPEPTLVQCTLAVDGVFTQELADCAGGRSLQLTLASAGSHRVSLSARDAYSRETQATTLVEVTNLAPLIESFAVAKARGTAPLVTSFSWTISDANGETLRCALHVDADSVPDLTLEACESTSVPWTFSTPGKRRVRLTVSDSNGASTDKTLEIDARQAVGDLRIARVEWGQTVLASNLRLVEGKPALLRAYVVGDRSGIAGVEVTAQVMVDGGVVGELTLNGPTSAPTAEDPADLPRSYRTTVQAGWITEGMEVRLHVDPRDLLAETDEGNNDRTLRPDVGKGNVLHLTAVPIRYGGSTGTVPDHDDALVQLWPLKEVNTTTRPPYTFSGSFTGDFGDWNNLLGQLSSLRAADGSSRYYYGFINPGSGFIAGLGFIGQPVAVGLSGMVNVMSHELGHNFGLPHAPCGGASNPAAGFPYPGAKIGTWGYDVASGTLFNPAYYVDVMSYCQPTWVSDYFYRQAQTRLESAAYGEAAVPPLAPMLLVSASVRGDDVRLQPLMRILSVPTESSAGEYRLRLVGPERTTELVLDAQRTSESDVEHLTAVVPDPGPLIAVELLRGARLLEKVTASVPPGGSPFVELHEAAGWLHLRWDGQRYPAALVAHLGDERTTLTLWARGGEAVLELGSLPEGGRFEIGLSDGLNPVRIELPRR